MNQDIPPKEFVEKYGDLKRAAAKTTSNLMHAWIVGPGLSRITGFAATFLLLFNLSAHLADYKGWPV